MNKHVHPEYVVFEAPSHGKPIVLYDIMSNGSSNYLKLAREVMERNEPQAQTL